MKDILLTRLGFKIGAKEEEIEVAKHKLDGYKEAIKDIEDILESLGFKDVN